MANLHPRRERRGFTFVRINNDPSALPALPALPFASGYLLGNIIGRKNNPQPPINNQLLEEQYRIREEQLKLLNQNKK